jgi:hypothetical protein
MTLVGTEFLRRFFLHVLPRAFVRIRHFGFLPDPNDLLDRRIFRAWLAAFGATNQ